MSSVRHTLDVYEIYFVNCCPRLGIALFQAQNMQLFSLFWGQKHLVWLRSKDPESGHTPKETHASKNFVLRLWYVWQDICILRKTYILIAIGTGLQVRISKQEVPS